MEAGYKTGLYTSPHLIDFRERISINGKMIKQDQVIRFIESIQSDISRIRPSFFEMTVAMAFDHFAKEEVDIAIIETGLGGRLDSTNIISPELSIITNISLDHMEFLGDSEIKIAREKAGIIKNKIPCVCGLKDPQLKSIIKDFAAKINAQVLFSDEIRQFNYKTYDLDGRSVFHYKNIQSGSDESIISDLKGTYQNENLNTALTALEYLDNKFWKLSEKTIEQGLQNVLRNTNLRGRWEVLAENPRVICDIAHNEAGVKATMEQLLQIPAKKLHIVWGMLGDKSINTILPLLPPNANYYFTQASIPRALPAANLMGAAKEYKLEGNFFPTVIEAYKAALNNVDLEDTVFVGGSTFVVADLLMNL
jgi:dihydrofolate synthase/folylpolyglutamate synthase